MNLADPCTDGCRRLDLGELGIDEYARTDTGVSQASHRRAQTLGLADDIKAALSGHFMTTFRHQHRHLGFELAGDRKHFIGRCHLEIELDMGELAKPANILVLDVTTIFAKMHRDAVGAAQMGFDSRPDRVRFIGAARLADGGHMVDVDAEFDHRE